jgi:hypothetical protein
VCECVYNVEDIFKSFNQKSFSWELIHSGQSRSRNEEVDVFIAAWRWRKWSLARKNVHSQLKWGRDLSVLKSLKQLLDNRMQQTHVLGASDRQPVYGVVVHHFWYRSERLAELAQNVLASVSFLLDSHVHKTTSTPGIFKF